MDPAVAFPSAMGLPVTLETLGMSRDHIQDYLEELGDKSYIEIGATDKHVVLGLGPAGEDASNALLATFDTRVISRSALPRRYLVIETLPGGVSTVLDTSNGEVRRWRSQEDDSLVAGSFREFMDMLKTRVKHFDEGHALLEQRVREQHEKYGYDRLGNGRLPGDRDWRVYRSCVQDVIIGETVVRYQPSGNCIEVDVFLTADIPELEELAGARTLALFILGEAVRTGTTLEVRFTKNVEGGRIPEELRTLAERVNVELGGVRQDTISRSESSLLLQKLSGMGSDALQRITELRESGAVDLEQLVFAVVNGSWSPHEMSLLLTSPDPKRLLLGLASPRDTLLHEDDRFLANAAVLAGRFIERVSHSTVALEREAREAGSASRPGSIDAWEIEETEDATIGLRTSVNPEFMSLVVRAEDSQRKLAVESQFAENGVTWSEAFEVLPRPLAGLRLAAQIEQDLRALKERDAGDKTPAVLLVPSDYWALRNPAALATSISDAGALLVVEPASLVEINEESRRRMNSVSVRLGV